MRIRATVAVATGALALSALVVPASQAADSHKEHPSLSERGFVWKDRAPQANKRALASKAATLPVITKTVINGGKPIVLGTTGTKKVTATITASDDSGIEDAFAILYTGGTGVDDENSYGYAPDGEAATCKAASATTSTCTLTFTVSPLDLWNTDAKTWQVYAAVLGTDLDITEKDKATSVKFQRASQLTVNAAPEPVKKNGTVTVTGKLSRANWDTGKYAGYATQSVILQFRKKTSTAYTNVKGVKTSTTGTLKTTTKATVDGYYRWSFVGTATTPAINVAGDYVDVK
ncbi:DUF5707 domain-containing protein [Streptomyces sp. NPDC006638]|uniref:DUF5707 domain-containing protein n=1 Tax=Streptomyces sp. NPDC006638 TaxID=3157183 RepID=UPI0033B8B744